MFAEFNVVIQQIVVTLLAVWYCYLYFWICCGLH